MFRDSLEGAVTIVVAAPKDMVVPFAEVCFFLVKELKFGSMGASEVAEHEGSCRDGGSLVQ